VVARFIIALLQAPTEYVSEIIFGNPYICGEDRDKCMAFSESPCCYYVNDQALSREVMELKNEKLKVQAALVTSSDAELAAEKKVNFHSHITLCDKLGIGPRPHP